MSLLLSAALTAAKSCPALKGLAWAPWSPVIQRCSRPCTFVQRVSSFLKHDNETHKPPPGGLRKALHDSSVKNVHYRGAWGSGSEPYPPLQTTPLQPVFTQRFLPRKLGVLQ